VKFVGNGLIGGNTADREIDVNLRAMGNEMRRSPVHEHADKIAELVYFGIQCLADLEGQSSRVGFAQWLKVMVSARGSSNPVPPDRLIWLWDTLTSEPTMSELLGGKLISIDEQWRDLKPMAVLPDNTRLGIFFRGFRFYDEPILPFPSDGAPDAEVVILAPLCMKPGKNRRLECMDVPTRLEMRPKDLRSAADESLALTLSPGDIEIDNGRLLVWVESLNHALSKANQRLRPNRRSHGGRIYDYIGLIKDGKLTTLEEIRQEHEERCWKQLTTVESKSD
jgi:hypothetical protein